MTSLIFICIISAFCSIPHRYDRVHTEPQSLGWHIVSGAEYQIQIINGSAGVNTVRNRNLSHSCTGIDCVIPHVFTAPMTGEIVWQYDNESVHISANVTPDVPSQPVFSVTGSYGSFITSVYSGMTDSSNVLNGCAVTIHDSLHAYEPDLEYPESYTQWNDTKAEMIQFWNQPLSDAAFSFEFRPPVTGVMYDVHAACWNALGRSVIQSQYNYFVTISSTAISEPDIPLDMSSSSLEEDIYVSDSSVGHSSSALIDDSFHPSSSQLSQSISSSTAVSSTQPSTSSSFHSTDSSDIAHFDSSHLAAMTGSTSMTSESSATIATGGSSGRVDIESISLSSSQSTSSISSSIPESSSAVASTSQSSQPGSSFTTVSSTGSSAISYSSYDTIQSSSNHTDSSSSTQPPSSTTTVTSQSSHPNSSSTAASSTESLTSSSSNSTGSHMEPVSSSLSTATEGNDPADMGSLSSSSSQSTSSTSTQSSSASVCTSQSSQPTGQSSSSHKSSDLSSSSVESEHVSSSAQYVTILPAPTSSSSSSASGQVDAPVLRSSSSSSSVSSSSFPSAVSSSHFSTQTLSSSGGSSSQQSSSSSSFANEIVSNDPTIPAGTVRVDFSIHIDSNIPVNIAVVTEMLSSELAVMFGILYNLPSTIMRQFIIVVVDESSTHSRRLLVIRSMQVSTTIFGNVTQASPPKDYPNPAPGPTPPMPPISALAAATVFTNKLNNGTAFSTLASALGVVVPPQTAQIIGIVPRPPPSSSSSSPVTVSSTGSESAESSTAAGPERIPRVSSLSSGALVGVVIGVLVGVSALGILVLWFCSTGIGCGGCKCRSINSIIPYNGSPDMVHHSLGDNTSQFIEDVEKAPV